MHFCVYTAFFCLDFVVVFQVGITSHWNIQIYKYLKLFNWFVIDLFIWNYTVISSCIHTVWLKLEKIKKRLSRNKLIRALRRRLVEIAWHLCVASTPALPTQSTGMIVWRWAFKHSHSLLLLLSLVSQHLQALKNGQGHLSACPHFKLSQVFHVLDIFGCSYSIWRYWSTFAKLWFT